MADRPPVLVEGLTVIRGGKRVVDGVSFAVAPAAITALLGANGAGKSSIVLAMAGAIPTAGGRVRLGERRLSGLPPDRIRRLGVALVAEGHRVLGPLTVEENLTVACPAATAAQRRAGLGRVLDVFPELADRRRQLASNLSGGQKQMLSIGQALICDAAFMLVDELSLGLAPTIVRRLAGVLTAAREAGMGVLLIEQFASLALGIADRAMILERSRLVYDGDPATLKEQPDILHGAYSLSGEAAEGARPH